MDFNPSGVDASKILSTWIDAYVTQSRSGKRHISAKAKVKQEEFI